MEQLPKYVTHNFTNFPNEGLERLYDGVRKLQTHKDLPPSLELTPELKTALHESMQAVSDFAGKLGFDISSRMPQEDHIHIYDRQTFRQVSDQAKEKEYAENGVSLEGFERAGHLFLPVDNATPHESFTHELTHAVDAHVMSLRNRTR